MRLAPLAAVIALFAAAPAPGGVRVVPPFDPDDYEERAAVGLLVPGAGPTVTRDSALNALLRGELEHELLGGTTPGDALIELGDPGGPEILVSLPPPGRSENDRRYPIALLGERGLLTSDSTRIDGLVSITDVATGRLRVVDSDDPVAALETLDDRIDRNDRLRLPLTIALAALLIGLSLVRPGLALRALLVALAANLWLDPVIAIAAGAAAVALPLGLACASILAAYLVSMGLDAEAVALSPFGPSQSGRFYGINNLLETMLLAPSLVGAALLGRRAASASPRSPSSRSGATASARTAAGSSCSPPPTSCSGSACAAGGRRCASPPESRAGAVAVALLVLGLDATTGGSSHVTDAVGDGPVALAADLADRIELSVRRTAASAGVDRGRARLARHPRRRRPAAAARRGARRLPRRHRRLAPRQRHSERRGRDRRRDRDRACPAPASARLVTLTARCVARPPCSQCSPSPPGSQAAAARRRSRRLPRRSSARCRRRRPARRPARRPVGDVHARGRPGRTGEAIYASAGCGGCHTLEAAGSSGTVGPNLDDSQPDFELAVDRVTNGSGAMPSFEGQLSEQEIADVAAYVVENTSG